MADKTIIKDHYIYKAIVSSLAAAASTTVTIQLEADADFVLVKTSYFADLAGTAQTDSTRIIPLVHVQIQDSSSGRNLQNLPIPLDSMAGRGELPFVFPIPRIFKANSSIKFTFDNFSAATTYTNIELSLIGFKVFEQGA